MADFFEVLMVISFGISWPFNLVKAWKARTTKGMSLVFYFFIWFGYIVGILSKVIKQVNGIASPFYIWFFYSLNLCMLTAALLVYYRNYRLDKKNENTGN